LNDKNQLIVFGASGHAKVVIDIIEQQGSHTIAGLLDDDVERKGARFFNYPIFGTRAELPILLSAQLRHVIVAIGDNGGRATVALLLEQQGWHFVTAVHPRASIGRGVEISTGSAIMAGCIINADALVGRHAIINTGATIDHDCRIGDAVHVGPGCHLCGGVSVGAGSFLGAGTTVVPGIRIGSNVTVGAGSTVIRDIADGQTVFGAPAKPIA
jgi:sugar O-acyltransferase (sialic acid O-acetyltransferase NeuD family)